MKMLMKIKKNMLHILFYRTRTLVKSNLGKIFRVVDRIFIQHFAATDKHFTAIKLFWYFGLAIIKYQSVATAKVFLLPLTNNGEEVAH